jgi:hypothetical protein
VDCAENCKAYKQLGRDACQGCAGNPYKEELCPECGRMTDPEDWCICPEHVFNTVPF